MDETEFSMGWQLSNKDSLLSSKSYNLLIPAQPCVFTSCIIEYGLHTSYTNKKTVSAVAFQTCAPKLLFWLNKGFPVLLTKNNIHRVYMSKGCHCTFIILQDQP